MLGRRGAVPIAKSKRQYVLDNEYGYGTLYSQVIYCP